MSGKGGSSNYNFEDDLELRRGPWTLDEDTLLIHYIACHGEGRWNLLAKNSGLKRTGKSCRLRWLNYLKPDVKRGNLSPEEQLLILELHSKWGNRWSRIAQHLPGRTDNEIKNYWRTRVQKQARHLKIDVNSVRFRDVVRCYWMPRLLEMIGSSDDQQCHSTPIMGSNTSTDHPNITTSIISGSATTQVASFQEDQYSFQYPNVLIHSDQFESSSTYDQYLPGGGNQSPCSKSSVTTAAAQLPLSVPSFSGFPPSTSNYELNNVVLGGGEAYSNITILGSMGAPASAAINHCTDSRSSTGDDELWNIDELYDILKSYMKGMAESQQPS